MANEQRKPASGTFSKLMGGAPRPEQQENKASEKARKKLTKQESNITILQLFSEKDVAELREPAYMAQTYRLRERDIEWTKDTAYELSKEFKRRKISQTDILRISLKLFEKVLAINKAEVKAILDKIK